MAKEQLFVQMALEAWQTYVSRSNNLFSQLTDEDLMREIAPGRNRGIYLLGHLVAVHDAMCDILELGKRKYAALDEIFLSSPDRAKPDIPPASELRNYWNEVNERLAGYFEAMTADQWFAKHARISAEDFQKEPHRNKLNVLMNRTGHLAYHTGQVALLKKKQPQPVA